MLREFSEKAKRERSKAIKQPNRRQGKNLPDGIGIPNSLRLCSFRPISLLHVEGKIFLGIIGKRMTSFPRQNKYISMLVQKTGIPWFLDGMEHTQMMNFSTSPQRWLKS